MPQTRGRWNRSGGCMDTLLAIFAAIAAVIGAALVWWRWSVGRELTAMAATHPSGAGGIPQLPVGSAAAVSGTLRVRAPLTAEFSGQPCAYFKAEIEREEVKGARTRSV